MGKVNSDITRKVEENRTFQSQTLHISLHILHEAKIHTVSKIWEKVNFHSTGKVWENTNIQKL